MEAPGCENRAGSFQVTAPPGEIDTAKGGAGNVPPGWELELSGNNSHGVRDIGLDGRTLHFSLHAEGKGTVQGGSFGLPKVCVGAEGANSAAMVYTFVFPAGDAQKRSGWTRLSAPLAWLDANHQWVFSGIGVLIVSLLLEWWRRRRQSAPSGTATAFATGAGPAIVNTGSGDVNITHVAQPSERVPSSSDARTGKSNLGPFALRTAVDGRSLDVAITVGFLTFERPRGLSDLQLMIEVANSGNEVVHVQSVSVRLPGEQQLLFLPPTGSIELPCALAPGASGSFWSDAAEVAKRLKSTGFSGSVNVVACFRDSLGNTYLSQPRPFDVDSPG